VVLLVGYSASPGRSVKPGRGEAHGLEVDRDMGVLWEMHQQRQRRRLAARNQFQNMSQDQRIAALEQDFEQLDEFIGNVVRRIEAKLAVDLDGDGKVG
jgi:hypothetical protein